MKALLLSTATLVALTVVSCGPSPEEQKAAREKAVADSLANLASMERAFIVDASASSIDWTGTMLGVKKHHGVIRLTNGSLTVKGNAVVAGTFTIDMNSIAPEDSLYAPDDAPQGTRANLVGHLKSDQFFDAAAYPTATFVITSVQGNTAKGNLTLRGKTNEETVTDIALTEENGVLKASGKITFDRQKYGVAWDSGSQEAVLSDNIDLKVDLVATAAK